MRLGCNCCETPLSACEACCEALPYVISAFVPDNTFNPGTFELCEGCDLIHNRIYDMNNFTVLNVCDWLKVDTTNICEGVSTSLSAGLGIRANTPTTGWCQITFRLGITCSGFVSYYDWQLDIEEFDCDAREFSLVYIGALDDGTCCSIVDPTPNVTIYI